MGRIQGKALRSIKPEIVKDLRKKLKLLPKVEDLGLSKTDAIRELRAEIEAARAEKGYSYKKIAEILSESGLAISGPAIKTALTSADEETTSARPVAGKVH